MRLVALEAHNRCLLGRAVLAHICNLTLPLRQMRFERLPARKAPTRDRVLLHIAYTALGLALRPGAIRRTGPWLEPPVPCEREEGGIECHRARGRIVRGDERARVVDQHLLRHSAKRREGALKATEPALLPLAAESAHVAPPRVAERGDEHECLHT